MSFDAELIFVTVVEFAKLQFDIITELGRKPMTKKRITFFFFCIHCSPHMKKIYSRTRNSIDRLIIKIFMRVFVVLCINLDMHIGRKVPLGRLIGTSKI